MQLTSPITSSKLIFAIFAESQAHKLAILGPGKVVLAIGVILICSTQVVITGMWASLRELHGVLVFHRKCLGKRLGHQTYDVQPKAVDKI